MNTYPNQGGYASNVAGSGYMDANGQVSTSSAGAHTHPVSTVASTSGTSGTGTAQNLPPYVVKCIWERIS